MGLSLWRDHAIARETFAEAEEALGAGLKRLCFEGPQAELTLTENAQPAILTVSIAALRVLEREVAPEYHWVAGHSLGEYSALVAAGAIEFSAAVKAVRLRGLLMQSAVPAGIGAMAAIIGLEPDRVEALCREVSGESVLAVANLNGAGQVVVSGHKDALVRLKRLAKDRGIKGVVDLDVSAPFHSPLMEPAARGMEEHLRRVEFKTPRVPVVTNVEARPCSDPEKLRRLLVAQVTSPVRWEESMRELACLGCDAAIEVGPGMVLSKLARRMGLNWELAAARDSESIAKLKGVRGAAIE